MGKYDHNTFCTCMKLLKIKKEIVKHQYFMKIQSYYITHTVTVGRWNGPESVQTNLKEFVKLNPHCSYDKVTLSWMFHYNEINHIPLKTNITICCINFSCVVTKRKKKKASIHSK